MRVRAGESFSQWQLPEATQGSYYAQLGDGPAGLGIKTAGRIRADYVATEETHALRSTAKTVTVDWDGPIEVAQGGRTQFFAPDRDSFKKVSGE